MGAGRRREPSASVLGRYIQPCDPTEVDSPPDGADWIQEIKWDGYRAQIHIQGPRIIIFSRKGFDWTREFRGVCEGAATLAVKTAVLDSEGVAVGTTVAPDLQGPR